MKSAANRQARFNTALINAALMAAALGATDPAQAQPVSGPAADYPMVLGAPFVVDGKTFTPADTLNYDAVGYAVPDAEGGGAISGAHRTLPLPCYVEVTALDSGRTVLVRLERRGPMQGDGLVALSPGALAQLGLAGNHAPVRVRRVIPPETERALLRTGQQAPARMDTPPGLLTALKRKLGILPPADPRPEALAAALAGAQAAGPAATPPPAPAPARPGAAQPKPVVRNTTPMPAPRPPAPPVAKPAEQAAKPALPKPAAKPAPQTAPKPEALPKPEPKPAPRPVAAGGYAVQVGAFSTRANAEKAAREVGGSVIPAGKFFRVRIGAASEAEAKAALGKAKRAGYADAQIQRAP